MRNTWRASVLGALCVAAASGAAGCGDDGNDASSNSGTTPAAEAAAPADNLVTEAQAAVQKLSENPTIGVDTKLTKTPPQGKKVVFLQCNYPICGQIGDGMEKATDALGWKIERKTFDLAKPEAFVSLVNNVAASAPDYVALTTFPSELWKAGLAKLKAKNVPVIVGSISGDEPQGEANGIYGNIASDPSEANAGTAKANWIIADSKGSGKAVHFSATDVATVRAETDALKKGMEACEKCSLDVVDVSSAALAGGKVPSQTVSYIQSHPDVKYVSYSFGDMTAGVDGALKAANLLDKIKFVGVTPSLANLKAMKSGEEKGAWLGWPGALQGWQFIDVAARLSVGDEVGDSASPLLPVQWLTQDSITEPVKLYEPTGYQDAYKALWGL